MFSGMNDQMSSRIPSSDAADHDAPKDRMAAATSGLVRPVQIGPINWIGLWTLYLREVQRFAKVGMQTVIAPVITSMLFLMVFAVAVGFLAFEVCFQIVGPLTRDAQGHFDCWLHLSVHYPGV